jgi:hypothetical protein
MLLKMWISSCIVSSPSVLGGSKPAARYAVSIGILNARAIASRVNGCGLLFRFRSLLMTARFKSAARAQSDCDHPRLSISTWSQSANRKFRPTENILSQSLFLWGADLLRFSDKTTLKEIYPSDNSTPVLTRPSYFTQARFHYS